MTRSSIPPLRFPWPLLALASALSVLPTGPATAADTRNHCDVAFTVATLPEATTLGFIDFTVQYERPKIFPPDPQGKLRCSALVPGAAVAVTNTLDNSSAGTLTLAFATAEGAVAGAPLLRCEVYSAGSSVPVPADFPVITTLRARSTTGAAIDPLPAIGVGEVRCGDDLTTTTTTTTTTTLEPPSTTTTTLPREECSFGLTLSGSGNFRRVLVEVDYSGAGGELASAPAAACRSLSGSSIGIGVVGDDAAETLVIDTVSVGTIHAPFQIARCDFVPTAFVAGAADFDIGVLAAADASAAPALPLPAVLASGVICPGPATTTTLGTETTTTTTTMAAGPLCGDANNDGELQASDALAALRKAVGLTSICPLSRCDVDSGGSVKASDALLILQAAVGGSVVLDCP